MHAGLPASGRHESCLGKKEAHKNVADSTFGGHALTKPPRERQGQRLGPKFALLVRATDDPAQIMQLQQHPQAIAPEHAIIFEIAGSVTRFTRHAPPRRRPWRRSATGTQYHSRNTEGFTVLQRRWVVERAFAWKPRCRHLSKDCERSMESCLAWAQLVACRFMMRRIGSAATF